MNMKKWLPIVIAGLLILAAAAYTGITLYLENDATAEIEKAISQSHLIRELSYQKLRVSLIDRKITLSDILVKLSVTADSIQIDRITVKNNRSNPDIEDHHIAVTGIHLPSEHSALQPVKPLLSEMGYDSIEGQLAGHYRYDRNQNQISLEKAIFGVSNAFEVTISLKLNGFSPADIEKVAGNPFAALNAFQNTALSHAEISYSDQSFCQRSLAAYSRLSNVPTTKITDDLIHQINEKMKNTQTQSMKNALTALKQFVEKPTFIQFASAPTRPVFLKDALLTSMIQGPEALMDLFHIQVSTSPESWRWIHLYK